MMRLSQLRAAGWLDVRHSQPGRAFALSAVGCLVGLGIAGTALFQTKATSTMFVPADAVAVVNQQPISRIDYSAQVRALGLDPLHASRAERRRVVEDMIREELFVQRGKELDVALVDPEVRTAMVRAVEAQAAANALTSAPDMPQLRAFYAAHRARYAGEGTMQLRDLVFPPASGAHARDALRGGEPPQVVLARLQGRDSGRLDGEEFYFAARIHLGEPLFAVAQRLKDGQVSDPVTLADGEHVLVMEVQRPPRQIAFEAARVRVLSDLQAEAVARFQAAEAAFLRRRASVQLAPDVR